MLYDERQDITLAAKAYPTADSWLADVDGRIFRIYDQAYVRWFRCYIREVVGIAQNVVMLGVEPVKGSGEIEYFKLGDINLVFDPFDQDSVEIDASAIGINNQTATTQQQVMSSGDIKRMMAGGTGIPASVFAPPTPQKTTVSATAVKSESASNVDDIDYDHPSEQYRNIDDDFDTIDTNLDNDTTDASHLGIDVKPDVTDDETDTHSDDAKVSAQKTDTAAADIDGAAERNDAVDSKPTDSKSKSTTSQPQPDEHQEAFHASDTVKHDGKHDTDDIPSDLFADLENVPDAETQETIEELRHMMYGDDAESFIFRDIELPDDDDEHMFYDLITGEKQKFHKMPQKTAGKKKASKRKQKNDDNGNITAKMSDDVRRSMESHIAEQQHTDDDADKQMPDDRTDDNDANIDSDVKQQHIDDDMQAAGTARDITMHDETYAVVMDDIDDDDTVNGTQPDDVPIDDNASDAVQNIDDDSKQDGDADTDDSDDDKDSDDKQNGKSPVSKRKSTSNKSTDKTGNIGKKKTTRKKKSETNNADAGNDGSDAASNGNDVKSDANASDAKGSDMSDEKPKRHLLSIDGMFDSLIEDDGYGSDVELDIDEFDLGDEAVSRINEMRDAAMRQVEEERRKAEEKEKEKAQEQSMEDTLRNIASELDIEIPNGVDAKMIVSVLDEMMMRRTAQGDVDAADASNDVEAETAADADADADADIDEATSGKKKRSSGKRSKKNVKKRDGRVERAVVDEDAVNEDSSVDGADADSKTDADQRSDADEITDAYMSMFDEQPTSDAMSVIEKFLKRYDDTVREQELRSKQMQGKVKSDGGSDDIDEVMADIEADIKASEESVKKRKSSKRKRPTSKKYVKTLHIDEESDGDDLMVETNVAAD